MKFIEGMLVGSMVTVGVEGAEKSIPSIFLYTKNCCNVIKNIKKSLHLYLGIV